MGYIIYHNKGNLYNLRVDASKWTNTNTIIAYSSQNKANMLNTKMLLTFLWLRLIIKITLLEKRILKARVMES